MAIVQGGNVVETVVIALDTGEDLLQVIEEAIVREKIANGVVVSGIGSLSKIHYHIVEPGTEKPWKDTFFEKEGTIEVMALQGLIADGQPHLHITASQDDVAYGGHLEYGSIILTVGEVVILKLDQPMERRLNHLGVGQLHPKERP